MGTLLLAILHSPIVILFEKLCQCMQKRNALQTEGFLYCLQVQSHFVTEGLPGGCLTRKGKHGGCRACDHGVVSSSSHGSFLVVPSSVSFDAVGFNSSLDSTLGSCMRSDTVGFDSSLSFCVC